MAYRRMGHGDKETLEQLERIAKGSTDYGTTKLATTAFLWGNPDMEDTFRFAMWATDHEDNARMDSVMRWLVAQEEQWFEQNELVEPLVEALLRAMKRLYSGPLERLHGLEPISFAGLMKRPPFNHRRHASLVADAYLQVFERPLPFARDSFHASFQILKLCAQTVPEQVHEGLLKISSSGPQDEMKILVWQLYRHDLAATEAGQKIISTVLGRHPTLQHYCDVLSRTSFDESSWGEGEAEQLTKHAFYNELRARYRLATQPAQP